MAQQTALSVMAIPGPVHTFSAKEEAVSRLRPIAVISSRPPLLVSLVMSILGGFYAYISLHLP